MKKRLKSKRSFAPGHDRSDISGLILQVQQQLTFLDKKIDTLISQSPAKPFERLDRPKPFQRFDHSQRQGEPRQLGDYRERVMHKAICADCRKECEVPFRPSQDRPVYCKDCFTKRKASSPFKEKTYNRPPDTGGPTHASHIDRPHGGEKKKFFENKKFFAKKRPAAKRRKAHA